MKRSVRTSTVPLFSLAVRPFSHYITNRAANVDAGTDDRCGLDAATMVTLPDSHLSTLLTAIAAKPIFSHKKRRPS